MPERFSEDNIKGKIMNIPDYQEGFRWFWEDWGKKEKSSNNNNNQQQAERQRQIEAERQRQAAINAERQRQIEAERQRQAAIEAERQRNEAIKNSLKNTYNQTMIQYQQLVAQGNYLQINIIEQQQLIPPLDIKLNILLAENRRLKNKNISLNDNSLFFKNTVDGTSEKDGYIQKIEKNQKYLEDTIYQEVDSSQSNKDLEITPVVGGELDIQGFSRDGLSSQENSRSLTLDKTPEETTSEFRKMKEGIAHDMEGFTNNSETPINANSIVYTSSALPYQIIELNQYIDKSKRLVASEQQKVADFGKKLSDIKLLIKSKRDEIIRLPKENKKLQKTNNNILDDLQYNRSLVFGSEKVDGYNDTEINQHIITNKLINQPFGTPLDIKLYNNDNETPKTDITEGFISGSNAGYNAVYTENLALDNQITTVKNKHSIDDQLMKNILQRKSTTQFINKILIFIYVGVFLYTCFRLYRFPNINKYTKILIAIVIFSTISILHSIEYILLYTLPYMKSVLFGAPYKPPTYWSPPGKFDYLPTIE